MLSAISILMKLHIMRSGQTIIEMIKILLFLNLSQLNYAKLKQTDNISAFDNAITYNTR